jgi:hypothetical protein
MKRRCRFWLCWFPIIVVPHGMSGFHKTMLTDIATIPCEENPALFLVPIRVLRWTNSGINSLAQNIASKPYVDIPTTIYDKKYIRMSGTKSICDPRYALLPKGVSVKEWYEQRLGRRRTFNTSTGIYASREQFRNRQWHRKFDAACFRLEIQSKCAWPTEVQVQDSALILQVQIKQFESLCEAFD